MPARDLVHVFTYDITSNKARSRVSKLLEEYGVRVQMSVFEVRLPRRSAQKLAERIVDQINPEDSLRVYALDSTTLKQSKAYGGPPISEEQDFWLI